jgi:outer membrane PBP1 activator LpoA protein
MKLVAVVIAAVVLTGCAAPQSMPMEVMIMPNDCANKDAIVRWLEKQSSRNQTKQEYAYVRTRIWNLRYHCQPVG